jgi:DtxR family Mn-dependent transcriptional regulator
LVEKLGFKWDEVHDIAEELEHINSESLINRLDDFLGNPSSDPHGDPIPNRLGEVHQKKMVRISEMNEQECGMIAGVSEHSSVFLKLLEKLGLTLGTHILIREIIEYDGSITLIINEQGEKTISREVAKNILIII